MAGKWQKNRTIARLPGGMLFIEHKNRTRIEREPNERAGNRTAPLVTCRYDLDSVRVIPALARLLAALLPGKSRESL
jgi:hypothetical protein